MASDTKDDQLEPFFELLLRDIAKGDFESYAKATDILEKWLTSDPKTHPAVRVEIIRSLFVRLFCLNPEDHLTLPEVTQARAREEVNFRHGFDVTFKALQYQENRFVGEYIKLVRAVKSFEGIFGAEVKGLKDGFQAILATISKDNDFFLKAGELSQSPHSTKGPSMSEPPSVRVPSGTTKTKRKIDFEALVKADEEDFLRKQALAAREAKAKLSENITQPQLPATTQVVTSSCSTITSASVPVVGLLANAGQEKGAEVVTKPDVAATTVDPSSPASGSLCDQIPDTQMILEMDHDHKEVNSTNEPEKRDCDVSVADVEMKVSSGHVVSSEEVVAVSVPMVVDDKQGQSDFWYLFRPLFLLGFLGIFGPEMSVIARQLGLEDTFHISIEFEITQPQYELLSKWNFQREIADIMDLQATSICITLGCYLLADLKETYENNPTLGSFEKQVSCTPAKWPDHPGCLSVKILSSESENLPLSPPFHATPDNLVDLSSLLVLGKNRLELRQKCDLRHYMYILHAHHPTRRQIQQIEDQRQKNQEWQEFIDKIAAPFVTDAFASLTLDRYLRR